MFPDMPTTIFGIVPSAVAPNLLCGSTFLFRLRGGKGDGTLFSPNVEFAHVLLEGTGHVKLPKTGSERSDGMRPST